MIWLASLLGLMAMGGTLFVGDDDVANNNSEDDEPRGGGQVPSSGSGEVQPLSSLLPSDTPSEESDILSGGDGDDHLAGGLGDDQINGYDGDDLLDGGGDNDQLFGGEGVDTRDFVNGGEGDDTLVAGANDVLTMGDGADQIIVGDWIDADQSIEMMDFDPTEDQLVLLWDLQTQPDPDIEVEADPDSPEYSVVRVNGTEVLRVNSTANLTASDITLLDQDSSDMIGLPFS
ncbi:hypothetical protein FEE96_10305 [Parasedimentitalea maritima]|uniref:Calcium-binding protein n=1 Tax=Parasedimentitalea maritima TaxID=2578117 RepID=A0ABY2UWM9_9RHOB|nr:hypothetical protein [Zongyanglinia marina]TLP65877.1 hypothetical protein FEE96_10305 [Zongyanglinia marina]